MTRRNNIHAIVLGVVLAAAAGLAQAQTQTIDRGIYLGAGLGQSQVLDYECRARPQCETHGTPAKYFVGYQFGRHWSAEIGVTDLGKVGSETPGSFKEDLKARLGEITVLASYPASGRIMIYGKAGGYYAHTTDDLPLSGTRFSKSAGGVTWGFGLQYYMWKGLAARLEAQRYMKVEFGGSIGELDYKAITIGLLYKM